MSSLGVGGHRLSVPRSGRGAVRLAERSQRAPAGDLLPRVLGAFLAGVRGDRAASPAHTFFMRKNIIITS